MCPIIVRGAQVQQVLAPVLGSAVVENRMEAMNVQRSGGIGENTRAGYPDVACIRAE